MYLRFSVDERDEDSQQERGIVHALYAMEKRGELTPHEAAWFREIASWLAKHLAVPSRLTHSRRSNARNRAICWLKCTAKEHVARMRELVDLLETKNVSVQQHLTDRPGYIVYEDEFQIAAVPFSRETF